MKQYNLQLTFPYVQKVKVTVSVPDDVALEDVTGALDRDYLELKNGKKPCDTPSALLDYTCLKHCWTWSKFWYDACLTFE